MTLGESLRSGAKTLGLLALLALAGRPAAAQRSYPTPKVYNPGVYSRTRQTMSSRAASRAALEKKRPSSSINRSPGIRPPLMSPPASTPTTAPGNVTFQPVADQLMPRQMAQALGQTSEERRRFEELFSGLLKSYRERLKQAGAPPNDVSRAAAYLVTASYYAANDGRASLDDGQLKALRGHLHKLFSTDESFQQMTDRERQELFEDYGITASWIDGGFNIVKQAGDQEGMRQWREMARQNFTAILGAPPESVIFTADGVSYK